MGSTGIQQQAAECLAQGQYEDAIALYSQCIDADPHTVAHYWHLGVAWLLNGDAAAAQTVWFSVLMAGTPAEIDGWTLDLRHLLITTAKNQCQREHFQQAVRLYEQVLELDAESAEIHYGLGNVLAQQGNLDAAIASWQRAVAIDPGCLPAYRQQAEIWHRLGQFDAAIAAYSRVLGADATDLSVTYSLGLCLMHQGCLAEAVIYFERATQLDPRCTPAYGDWGMALLRQGRVPEAMPHLHRAIALDPRFIQRYLTWADRQSCDLRLQTNARLLRAFFTQSGADYGDAIACLEIAATAEKSVDSSSALTINPLSAANETSTVAPPQGFYESTWEWARAFQLETSHYFGIYPESLVTLTRPQTIDESHASVDIRFRFGEAIALPASFVAVIPNGRYWIEERSKTAVITEDDRILADVSPDFPILSPGHPDKHPRHHSIFTLPSLPTPTVLSGTTAVLSGLFNDAYFHWMFDVLPRFELLGRSGLDVGAIDYFLVNSQLPFQQETLKRLGIPLKKVLNPVTYPHIQAENLIVPSFPASISWMPKWVCDFLQKLVLDAGAIAAQPRKRLYISRDQTSSRRVINNDEIINLLDQFGFQTVILESMSVVEQAALLAQAEIVVAPHGGGLTNLVFCSPGTKIIELFSPNYVYPCYWLVSNLVQLNYSYVLGDIPTGFYLNQLLHPDPRTEDMLINPNHLLTLLHRLI